jgi:hypothetical protein
MRVAARRTCCTVRNGGRRGDRCREGVLQRQSSSQLQDIGLAQLGEGREHLEHVVHPALDEPRELGEERRWRRGTGCPSACPGRSGAPRLQLAPDAGQGQEQQVAPGKVDGVVGCVVVGYVLPGHAPVRSVDGRDRDVHDDEGWGAGSVSVPRNRRRWASSASSHANPNRTWMG